jgi:hypothetical protein
VNHIVIGLGGTGGKVIRAFRKLIYNEYREVSPEGLNLGFLYIDSDPLPMDPGAPGWKVLGTSTHLPEASKLLIKAENLAGRLDDLHSYPGLKPWIGDRNVWAEILGSEVSAAAAGQKRRLGRFLFACKAREFRDRLQSLAAELEKKSKSGDITFHVVAGLAGGTGAGTVLDVIAKLRQFYGNPERHRVLGYLLLPDRFPPANWNTGNYHAGGFAALTELNALSTTAYAPHDVETGERMNLIDPFNGVYLFEIENEKGYKADVAEEIPGVAADFLFQKIVVAKSGWDALDRMERAQNGDGTPETAPDSKVGQRSKRFLGFGIKRVAIPEEEIDEYLGFNFARQAINQLRYNNWQESLGFADIKRNIDVTSIVTANENRKRWKYDDEYVLQGAPILPLDDPKKRWLSLDKEWEAVAGTLKDRARSVERPRWLDELQKLYEQRFNELFRGVGVNTFFSNKATARKEMAREIGRLIEVELFADWRNGVRSISEIADLIDGLISDTAKRRDAVDDEIVRIEKRDAKAMEDIRIQRERWASLGLFSTVTGKPNKVFDTYAISLQEHYAHRTRLAAWGGFAKGLFAEVSSELERIRATVNSIAQVMAETLRKVSDGIEERLKDADRDDLSGTLIRFYEPDQVRRVTRDLVIDESTQAAQTAKVRQDLVALLGDTPSFSMLDERMSAGELADRILSSAEENARQAHDTQISDARSRIRGVSIVAKLRERYDRDSQALGQYVTGLVKEAGCFLKTSSSERNRVGPGIPNVPALLEQWIVVIPRAPEHADFISQLKQAFRDAQSGALEFIEVEGKQNEITIISLKNLFPLRYLDILPMLRDEYDRRVKVNPVRYGFEVHCEGGLSDYPSLFVESGRALRARAYSYLLAALTLDIVRSEKDGYYFYSKDEDGFDNLPLKLGATLVSAPEAIDPAMFATLRREVDARLAAHKDKLALIPGVQGAVESVKSLVDNDLSDPRYRDAVEAGKAAVQLLKAA